MGIALSVAFVYLTRYYTSSIRRPVREMVASTLTGPATTIITGIAIGFERVALPVLTICAALGLSFFLGSQVSLPLAHVVAGVPSVGGIFGTAVATMGMLMSCASILSMDTFFEAWLAQECWLSNGQPEVKSTSPGGTTFSPELAFVEVHQGAADSQPQSQAIDLAGQAHIYQVEAFKDALQVLVGNTSAIITDTDFQSGRSGARTILRGRVVVLWRSLPVSQRACQQSLCRSLWCLIPG